METESSDSINITNSETTMTVTIHKPGDFSFVNKYKEYQGVFEYDYKVVNRMGEVAWKALKNWDDKKPFYLNDIINNNLYPGHSALTYRLSLNNLIFIANHGWENFILSKNV